MEKKYLVHFGIKGQKWGHRRFQNEDGSYTEEGRRRYNINYSQEQRYRDKRVYGSAAVKRINRDMNNGMTISGARALEADRINSARRKARVAGQVGSVAGGVAGFVLNTPAKNLINKYTGYKYSYLIRENDFIISAGIATVSSQLGRYGGQSVAMLLNGYSPKKYR